MVRSNDDNPATPGAPDPATVPPTRVVLVGRTGLEAALRRLPGITLLRTRGPFDAIGELAEDAAPDDGVKTVVLAAPDALPADRSGSFVGAVRRIDAHARFFAIDSDAPPFDGFDGVVPKNAAPSALLDLADEPPPTPPAPAPAHAPAPVIDSAAPDSPPGVHDHTPLGAMLTGKDPIEVALTNIRALIGADAAFIPAADLNDQNSASGASVVHRDRLLGRLVADGVPPEQLAREASWLAGWVMLHQQQEQLRRAAFTDELTGAWNRRYFNRFLGAAIDQAQAQRRTVTLLVFDIDNFKMYNDKYGHAAGDEILIQSVKLLTSGIRPSDRVCRIGGDEFVVIFHDPEGPRNPASPQSGKGPTSVADIARRFQKQICEHRFPKLLEQAAGTLTISGGLATYPWDGGTVDALLERADDLALQSKRQGKNLITLGQGAIRACEIENT